MSKLIRCLISAKGLTYLAHFVPAREGGFCAHLPSFPRCFFEGDTFEETYEGLQEALEMLLDVARDYGESIPPGDIEISEPELAAA